MAPSFSFTADVMELVRVVLPCLPARPGPTTTGGCRPSPSARRSGEDRISRLPDAVLCDIVSRLPAKDAAHRGALQALAPRLGLRAARPRRLRPPRPPRRRRRPQDQPVGMLSRWLRRLADGGAEHLVLVNRPKPTRLPLPSDVLRIASLRTLHLAFWTFPDTPGHPRGPAVFPRLQEIGLYHVFVDDRDVDHLLTCSPVLEKLAYVASFYQGPFRIRSRSLQWKSWMSSPWSSPRASSSSA
ncbi:unnamed protein product [Urochloa humidicola]